MSDFVFCVHATGRASLYPREERDNIDMQNIKI